MTSASSVAPVADDQRQFGIGAAVLADLLAIGIDDEGHAIDCASAPPAPSR